VVDSHTPELSERVRRTGEKLARTMDAPPFLSQPLQAGRDAGSFTPVPGAAAAAAPLPASGFEPAGGSLLVVTAPEALLLASPQPGAAVLLTLGRGAAVRLGTQPPTDGASGRWRQVGVGEVRGWVAADAVQPVSRAAGALGAAPEAAADSAGPLLGPFSTPVAASAAAGSQVLPRLRVIAERLALRVTPDINAPVLRRLRAGALVDALPQAQRGRWTAVQAGELRGWVASHWLAPDDRP
jgi:pilus assembly protein CpaC